MSKVLVAALAGVTLWFAQTVGGEIEGRLFPVVDPAYIVRITPVSDVGTRIWGRSDRLRNCSFERLEWRLGSEIAYAVVDLELEEMAKVRGAGAFEFGPWPLQLTPEQLFDRSYAIVFHRCHWLWLTQSRFYR